MLRKCSLGTPDMSMHAKADPAEAIHRRTILTIATATGSASLLINVWYPFLPLYLLQVGARDEASALFWVAVGMTSQGVARLLGGPLWGMLSDRVGRKKMFVRALYSAAITAFVLSIINAPWQVAIALGLQGLLSGFIPAAIALMTVSVPDAKVKNALSMASGGQYLGSAAGPAVGAGLAIAIGYRGAIFASGVLVAALATAVIYLVPADRVRKPGRDPSAGDAGPGPFKPTLQLGLAILLYFSLFALGAFRAISTPIALKEIAGPDVAAINGLTFALGGVASALGVWVLSVRFLATRPLRQVLVVTLALSALGHLLLALAGSAWLYILAFTLASFLNAALMPVANTMIAFNVSRERRGTAFGYASAAQALAFMAGPMAAAGFASFSLKAGFVVISILLLALTALTGLAVREPAGEH